MTAESLVHVFIFIGIMSTWLFPLWLYFHWLRYDEDFSVAIAIAYSGVYFTLISHYFKLTGSIYV